MDEVSLTDDPSGADWKGEANERIDQIRKRNLTMDSHPQASQYYY